MRMFAAVSVILMAQMPAFAQSESNEAAQAEKLSEDQKSARRLEFLNNAIQRFRVRQTTVPPVIAKPPKTAAVRWINPHSGSRDGILSIFHSRGRPVCMAQLGIYSGGNAIHEFHVTSDTPFELLREDKVMWKSNVATLQFRPLEKSPERRVFNRGHMGQFVGDYRMEPDDPKLKPLLPGSDQSK